MNKSNSFFKSFLPFVFFMVLNLVISIVMMVVFAVRDMTSGTMDTDMITYLDTIPTNTDYTQTTSIVFAVVIIIFFTIWYRRVFVRPLKNKPRKYWSGISFQVIIGLLFLGFGLQYIAQIVYNGIGLVSPELIDNYLEMISNAGYGEMSLLLAIYSLILAPIAEELAFRGLTMRFARQWMPFWVANIFQAALFGIMHLNVVQGLYAFTIGLFLGWVCKKGHSIKYSIILHIIFNILGTLCIDFFEVTLELHDYAFYLVGIGLAVFAILILHWEFKGKNSRQQQRGEEE